MVAMTLLPSCFASRTFAASPTPSAPPPHRASGKTRPGGRGKPTRERSDAASPLGGLPDDAGAGGSDPRSTMSLPRGRRDLFRQLGLWLGLALAYEIARGFADRGESMALENAGRVVAIEQQLGGLLDLDLQRLVLGPGGVVVEPAGGTYWPSRFAGLM